MKGNSNSGEATILFESVVVRDSHSRITKEFRDVPIEVTLKEIYVGSNYKVKWKHVVALRCQHDLDDVDETATTRTLQDYRDVDYERAGFELTCQVDSKKTLETPEERTFLVRFPIPPDGQRAVARFWETFSKALRFAYKKETRKRQKKLEKEQRLIDEELQEQQLRRKEFSKSYNRNRRSYSKRPYDFMRKNAANIAHNAEQWSDDEEESLNEPQKRTPELVAEEEVAANESEESEEEFEAKLETVDGEQNNEDHIVENGQVNDKNGDDDDDEEDSVSNFVASKTSKNKRIKRRGPVLEDSEDEDEDLFQSKTAEMTAPQAERVVTPATAKATMDTKKNKRRLLDDEDDEDDDNQDIHQEKAQANESDDEEIVQNNQKINSFFQPRTKAKTAAKENGDAKDKQESGSAKESTPKPKNSFFAPKSKTPSVRTAKTPMTESSPKKKKRIASATKKFLDNDLSDSDGDEKTVIASETKASSTPSRSPFLRAHSPKSRKSPFGIVRASESQIHGGRTTVEDEDPIEEVESSQSQSPMKRPGSSLLRRGKFGRLNSSIKRRRLRANDSALEALEFADARAQHLRSPISASRKNVANSTTGIFGERSPLQPLKLGPQVEMAVSLPKFRGLRNDGNSCYVNSSLQQLFSVAGFMQALSGLTEGHDLTTKLYELYQTLLDTAATTRVASAKPFKRVVDRLTDRFHGYQQRDAHEFLGEVIDQVHEELSPKNGKENNENSSNNNNKSQQNPTDDFFKWNVQVCLKCKSCGYSRSKEEMYRYLSIDIGHDIVDPRDPKVVKPAVDSCLAKFFAPEDREVNCEKCEDGKIATQTMNILSVPKVILLHLKRFMVVEKPKAGAEETEMVFKKNKAPVELTTHLSVDKLLTSNQSSDKLPSESYRLKSIVHHIGNTANSGHYTTDALRPDPEEGGDRWVSFDDGVVVENSLDKIVNTTKHQKTAYMLLYSRD